MIVLFNGGRLFLLQFVLNVLFVQLLGQLQDLVGRARIQSNLILTIPHAIANRDRQRTLDKTILVHMTTNRSLEIPQTAQLGKKRANRTG